MRALQRCRTAVMLSIGIVLLGACSAESSSVVLEAEPEQTSTSLADLPAEQPVEKAPLGQAWRPLNEPGVGGWLTAAAIDPDDAGHLLLGGDLLGLASSGDGGESWIPSAGWLSYELAGITMPEAGTGGPIWAATLSGPHRSDDGGITWTSKRVGMPELDRWEYSAPISTIAHDPEAPGRLVAFGGYFRLWAGEQFIDEDHLGTVWESDDAGDSWAPIAHLGANITEAVMGFGGRVTAVVAGRGVARSADGGHSWVDASETPPGEITGMSVVSDIVFIASEADEESDGGLWSSHDRGDTWRWVDLGSDSFTSTTSLSAVAMSPSDPDIVYLADRDVRRKRVYRSGDGGETWEVVLDGSTAISSAYVTPPDLTGIEVSAVDPQDVVVFGSEYALRTRDGGDTWTNISSRSVGAGWHQGRGFSGLVASGIHFNPGRPGEMVLTGQDGANFIQSYDDGLTWRRGLFDEWNRWGGSYGITWGSTEVIYNLTGALGRFGGVGVSTDGGDTWTFSTGDGLPDSGTKENLSPRGIVAMSASSALVAIDGLVHRTVDQGTSWEMTEGVTGVGDLLWLQDAQIAMASGEDGVYLSRDNGSSWEWMPGSPWGGTRFAHNRRDGSVYVVRHRSGLDGFEDGGVWALRDGEWSQLLENDLASDVAIDPFSVGHLLVATDDDPFHDRVGASGVLQSVDGGREWREMNAGLTMLRVVTIEFDPHTQGRVVLGTNGGGFFEMQIPDRQG